MTLPKWDDFFNQRDLKAAESLPCINTVCFWRQLVTLVVTARWGTSARAQQWLVTVVIGNQSYFYPSACVSNSAEHFGSPVPIPAPETHIRAENVILAPPALCQAVWVARGLPGHCSCFRATTACQCGHWGQEQWENSTTCQVCLGGCMFTEWNKSSKEYQEALLTRGWSEKHPSHGSGRSWWDEKPYGKGKGKIREKQMKWFLLVFYWCCTLYS